MIKGLGLIPDKRDRRDYLYKTVTKKLYAPPVIDFEHLMTPVKDQGARGSCVAFTCAAIKEYQELRQRSFWKPDFDLSEEFMYRFIQEKGGGAYPRNAMKVLVDYGMPEEKFMPYDKSIKSDKKRLVKPQRRKLDKVFGSARRFRSDHFVRLKTIDEIGQSLASNGILFLGIAWYDHWRNPKKKVDNGYPLLDFNGRSAVRGYHAIPIVGMNVLMGAVKIKNQWGEGFGKKGYAYIDFEAIDRGATDIWAVYDKSHPLLNV